MQAGQRIAIYVRVSNDKQVDGFSLDGQEAVIRKYIELNGKTVYKVYRDAGVSGAIKDRKGLDELLRDARQGCFGEVVVWNISRISRKLAHLLQIVEEFNFLGIAFCSISEGIDITTSIGQFLLQMIGAEAQMQRESWMESAKIGMRRKAKIGKCNGGSMLGYKAKSDEEDSKGSTKLVIVPEEAEIVQTIFNMYAAGNGLKVIVNKLNGQNIKGKNGASFSITTVRVILTNVFYIGKIKYEKQYYEGSHDKIISNELWERVQKRLEKVSKPVTKVIEREFLLSGVLKCPLCGAGMIPTHTSWKSKKGIKRYYYYYTCGAYLNKGHAVCKCNNVKAIDAEEKVIAFLSEFFSKVFWRTYVIKVIKQKSQTSNAPLCENRRQLEKKLSEIAKKQSEKLKLYENDVLDKETFLIQMKQLKSLKDAFYEELVECEDEGIKPCKWSDAEIEKVFKNFSEILKEADAGKKRQLIRSLVKAIYVDSSRKVSEIELKFQPPHYNEKVFSITLAI